MSFASASARPAAAFVVCGRAPSLQSSIFGISVVCTGQRYEAPVHCRQRMQARSTAQRLDIAQSSLKLNKLGSSDIVVSEVCLGTMTWGMQNTEAEAHQQLDYAIKERGVTFIDTAEVYPVPSSAPNWVPGRTEDYIGSWLAANRGMREQLVIATKVSGYSSSSATVGNRYDPRIMEELPSRLDRESVLAACDGSLRRLRTSYIDLYQIHWPERYVPLWVIREYAPSRERADSIPIRETAQAIKELLDSGKIRAYGLSNETTFGVCEWCRAADELEMPRPVTIQNHFNLLDRSFEGHLAEACAPSNFNIGLLPWSVLGGGVLTGKYLGKLDAGRKVTDSSLKECRFGRFNLFQTRYLAARAVDATGLYNDVAKEAGVSLASLALAFCKTRWHIPSTIIGATNMDQLRENIDAFSMEVDPEVMKKIDEIHQSRLDPCVSL